MCATDLGITLGFLFGAIFIELGVFGVEAFPLAAFAQAFEPLIAHFFCHGTVVWLLIQKAHCRAVVVVAQGIQSGLVLLVIAQNLARVFNRGFGELDAR